MASPIGMMRKETGEKRGSALLQITPCVS